MTHPPPPPDWDNTLSGYEYRGCVRYFWDWLFGRRPKWRFDAERNVLEYTGTISDPDLSAIKRWHEKRMREMG